MTIYDLHLELEKRVKALTEAAGIHDLKVYIRNLPPLKYEGMRTSCCPSASSAWGMAQMMGKKSKITAFLGLGTKRYNAGAYRLSGYLPPD